MRELNRTGTPNAVIAPQSRALALSCFCCRFCFTVLVYYYFSKLTFEQDQIRFRQTVQEIQDKVKLRIATSITLLRAARVFLRPAIAVDAGEFERFVEQIELAEKLSGRSGYRLFAQVHAPKKRRRHRQDGARKGRRTSKSGPDELARRIHADPLSATGNRQTNEAIGFDMSTEPARRQAMETRRDTGKPTASGRVQLVQERDDAIERDSRAF